MSRVNINNARDEEYASLLQQIREDGVCPFCNEHLAKYHKNPIVREGEYWLITPHRKPYSGAKTHILFIYRKSHITSHTELSTEAWQELHTHLSWAASKYNADKRGSSFLMRSGKTEMTGATVEHLHAHWIVSEGKEPITARIG